MAEGIPLLRKAPYLARSRSERVAISAIATQSDTEMLEQLDAAHLAETGGNPAEAEYRYWRCTSLYPFHGATAFKYGEALLKQQKFQDAECWLRNAQALGVPARQCLDAIHICLAQQELAEMPADRMLKGAPPLDGTIPAPALYPDLHTIRAFSHLLLGDAEPSLELRLGAQRAAWDAESLLAYFIGLPEFRYKNLKLFLILKSRMTEGLI